MKCLQDFGIWERGDKMNHGVPELNATSIGMAKVLCLLVFSNANFAEKRVGSCCWNVNRSARVLFMRTIPKNFLNCLKYVFAVETVGWQNLTGCCWCYLNTVQYCFFGLCTLWIMCVPSVTAYPVVCKFSYIISVCHLHTHLTRNRHFCGMAFINTDSFNNIFTCKPWLAVICCWNCNL